MSFSRSAIYVGGALYWRVLTRDHGFGDNEEEDQETEMLLCFGIHNEQFQLISLPLECKLKIKTGTTTITTEQEQQLIDHRLLEFEVSPCIARLQTGEQQQRRNNDNCCCKVHLYVLKDRVKSEWSTEIFDVCDNTSMIQDMSNPPPCIIATATSSTAATTTTVTTTTTVAAAAATTTTSTTTHAPQPITQIMCAADRVILYWFDNVCVQFYDLRKKRLKMVKYTPADPTKDVELFSCKVRGQIFPYDVVDVDKLIYCRWDHIDYKLHIYVENSLPLKTFIPKECTILRDYTNWLTENKDIEDGLGYVYTDGKNRTPEFLCFCNRLSKEGSR
ncbi:uncharacterized protein LOC113343213 isoform X1 [Papaver somniferum]|uniref:uncharacterized protein LOC113343213 isoform X1 n=1 Tax=Papaver somniferum TaxID=3469 RepID=UPI000E6F8FF9|nr:uncharacterized protein LOC113343213 isoform X1 [Papaver somniferum]